MHWVKNFQFFTWETQLWRTFLIVSERILAASKCRQISSHLTKKASTLFLLSFYVLEMVTVIVYTCLKSFFISQ